MTLLEQYNAAALTPGHSVADFVKLMAAKLDELNARVLAPLRATDPSVPDLLPDETTFAKRMGSLNGHGDLLNVLRDMAVAIDAFQEWTSSRPQSASGTASKSSGACPKCGKTFAKGLHLHVRACKAAA